MVSFTVVLQPETSTGYWVSSEQSLVRASARLAVVVAVANEDKCVRVADTWVFGSQMGLVQTGSTVACLVDGCIKRQVCQ